MQWKSLLTWESRPQHPIESRYHGPQETVQNQKFVLNDVCIMYDTNQVNSTKINKKTKTDIEIIAYEATKLVGMQGESDGPIATDSQFLSAQVEPYHQRYEIRLMMDSRRDRPGSTGVTSFADQQPHSPPLSPFLLSPSRHLNPSG